MKTSHIAEMPKTPKRRQVDAKAQQQAQHAATISLIVKNTGKIQKEIGFRRARLKVRAYFCEFLRIDHACGHGRRVDRALLVLWCLCGLCSFNVIYF